MQIRVETLRRAYEERRAASEIDRGDAKPMSASRSPGGEAA